MPDHSDELQRLRAEVIALRRENQALRRAMPGNEEQAVAAAARIHLLESVVGKLPVILFRYDSEGVFLESVGAGLERLGLSDHEVEGLNVFDLYADNSDNLRAALAGETVHHESVRSDGDVDWAYLVCLTFDETRGSGAIGFAIDITARRKAERELGERARVLQSVLDGMDEGVLVVSRQGAPLFHNDAARRVLGADPVKVSAGEWPPGFGIFFPDGQTPCPIDELPLSRAIAGVSANGVELVIRRSGDDSDAEPRESRISCSSRPLYDAAGELHGGVIVFHDLTEQRRLEAERVLLERQMQHAQKLESLGVLAGGIAHDFNNLLVGVLGNAGLVRWKLPADSEIRPMIRRIERSAEQAADLCSQLLAYAGRGRFEVAPLDLSVLVQEVTPLLQASTSKRAVIEYQCDDRLPAVEADATQLQQVVMNLITNASEAIGDVDGQITLRTGVVESTAEEPLVDHSGDRLAAGRYVFVEVVDTGGGMDAETQARMFDPFYSTKFTGRGLGMAAVLGIVRGHGGGLQVRSKPGEGAAIRVCLPSLDDVIVREPSAATPRPDSERPGEARTILVVDDEEAVREVAKLVLESQGFSVLVAADGREAVERFRKEPDRIDAVLLDMMMPQMDGSETFKALRSLRPNVRVLLTSGYDELEATQQFAGQGLAGFVQKPYRPSQLLVKLREILDDHA